MVECKTGQSAQADRWRSGVLAGRNPLLGASSVAEGAKGAGLLANWPAKVPAVLVVADRL
jgi:hypothetical protein